LDLPALRCGGVQAGPTPPTPSRTAPRRSPCGQAQQHLAGGAQVADALCAQGLQLAQARPQGALAARAAEQHGVAPDLAARLLQEAAGGGPIERDQQAVEQGPVPGALHLGQLLVLGGHAAGDDGVDALVVGPAPSHQLGVVELVVADDRQQRLRQVVVDVGVHAEQQVPQRRQPPVAGGREGDRPGPGHLAGALPRLQGVQVQRGEGDVPHLHPGRVEELAADDPVGDRLRGAQVGPQEEALRVAAGLQRLQQPPASWR
jgi:hypothetical protein